MTENQWRWAEALQIERWKGSEALAYVADRIAALSAAGETAGVERFCEIEARLIQLQGGAAQ